MKKPKQKPDFRLEIIDGEMLLYHPAQTTIFYCNSSASMIWQLCNGNHTVQEIVDLLCEAYPEATDAIASDVDTTLAAFSEHGAIEY